MSVRVRIPSPLRNFTNGVDVIDADGGNIAEVLESLKGKAPGIETRLFKGPAQLNRFVNVFLNDENIHHLQKLDTPVKAGDEVSIVPAIAGGGPDVTLATTVAVKVRIPSMMRPHTGGAAVVEASGAPVGDALRVLAEEAPDLSSKLFKSADALNRNLLICLNDEDVRFLGNLDTPLKTGDEISITPAVPGGC